MICSCCKKQIGTLVGYSFPYNQFASGAFSCFPGVSFLFPKTHCNVFLSRHECIKKRGHCISFCSCGCRSRFVAHSTKGMLFCWPSIANIL